MRACLSLNAMESRYGTQRSRGVPHSYCTLGSHVVRLIPALEALVRRRRHVTILGPELRHDTLTSLEPARKQVHLTQYSDSRSTRMAVSLWFILAGIVVLLL